MKQLALLSVILISVICQAQVPLNFSLGNAYSAGTTRVDKYAFQRPVNPENADLTADEKAMSYIHYFGMAIDRPNTLIQVDKECRLVEITSFTKKLVKTNKKEIIYNDSEKTIRLIESNEEKEKTSYLVLLVVLSFVLMVISNILFSKKKKDIAGIIALIAAIAILVATFDITTKHFVFVVMPIAMLIVFLIVTNFVGSYGDSIFVFPLLIFAIIGICAAFIYMFQAGFTFILLLPACFFSAMAAFNTDEKAKESEDEYNYEASSLIYYILIIVHLILLFIIY